MKPAASAKSSQQHALEAEQAAETAFREADAVTALTDELADVRKRAARRDRTVRLCAGGLTPSAPIGETRAVRVRGRAVLGVDIADWRRAAMPRADHRFTTSFAPYANPIHA